MLNDLEQAAYHEAAHALFAAKHDMALAHIYLRPSGTADPMTEKTWVGQTQWAWRDHFKSYCMATDLGRAYIMAQFALAGDMAVSLVDGDEDEDESDRTWRLLDDIQCTDREGLEEALAVLSPDREDLRQSLACIVVDLVRSFLAANRQALDVIAKALLDSETHALTGAEVYALVPDEGSVTLAG